MNEFVGGTAAGSVDNEWEDLEEQEESGLVEGFEEWGVPLPTGAADANGNIAQKSGPARGTSASQELGLAEADTDTASAVECHEDGKNATSSDNWGSWGAAWTAFTSAVQQVRGCLSA